MSDESPVAAQLEQPLPAAPAASPKRRSMFDDPVVRGMAWVFGALVVLFLATIVGAFVSGVTSATGPRTVGEREVAVSGQAVREGSTDPAVWGQYISALVGNGEFSQAKRVIEEGRASVDDSRTAEFTLAEARLLSAQEKYKQAIAAAEKARKQMDTVHKKLIAGKGIAAMEARNEGLPENYYTAVLIEAYAYRDMKQWKNAIKQYDVYIKRYEGSSDILVDRGNAKIEAKDKAGAEADFRQALRFIPDDEEALAGLEKIGVKR
jgi:tetratricopeptide (TPR) repeat protein